MMVWTLTLIVGKMKVGDRANCERAMAAHTRFGGHFVQVSLILRTDRKLMVSRDT